MDKVSMQEMYKLKCNSLEDVELTFINIWNIPLLYKLGVYHVELVNFHRHIERFDEGTSSDPFHEETSSNPFF